MKVLVTGANGFLGSALLDQLKETQHTVWPLVRKKQRSQDIECNMENLTGLLDRLNQYQPDIIINCAAKVDFSQNSRQGQYKVNALAPAVLAGWCLDNGSHLIQISGSIVNGNSTTLFNSNTKEEPINYYGQTKLLADNAIQLSQCSHLIVRFGGIFGKGGPEHLGINRAINQAELGNTPIVFGQGNALRNYIHVQDAAKLLVYCLDRHIRGVHYSGSQQVISIRQMIDDICSVYLSGVKPVFKSGPEGIDQITEVSDIFPNTKTFESALRAYQ